MADAPLATPEQLAALLGRTEAYAGDERTHVETLLDTASRSVRNAARSHISEKRTTVVLECWDRARVLIPMQPVSEIHSVTVGGEAVGYRSVGPWLHFDQKLRERPEEVTVEITYGYNPTPEDVVSLVCALTANAVQGIAQSGQLGQPQGVISEGLGAYRVAYSVAPGTGQATAVDYFEIPERTAKRLRRIYGPRSI